MENQTDNDTPVSAHEPGQVFGPSQSAPPVSPTSPGPPAPALQPSGERPVGVAAPAPTSGVMVNGQAVSYNEQASSSTNKSFRPSKKLLVPVIAALVLLGGSTAAYFGYVVPNKPQNVLAKAVQNSLLAQSLTSTGTINITSSGVSGKVDYTAKVDNNSHALDLNLDTTISGVEIPVELMSANGNLYFKIGNLTTVEGLISQFGAAFGANTQQFESKLNKAVSNQWIVVDSTLVKEAKLSCLTNYPARFSQADVQALSNSYKNDQFVTINSHSSDMVNGQSATKYGLSIDDNKLSAFDLSGAGYFKGLNSCLKSISSSSSLNLSSLKDGDTTQLTVWVGKGSEKIVKYASQSTSKDKANGVNGNLTGTVSYGSVNIQPPAKAKPVLNLVNELGLGDLTHLALNGNGGGSSSASSSANDTERQTDLNALQSQLEAAFANNGYYPTLAQLNSSSWRSVNMLGVDLNAFKDPDGTSSSLVASPAAHVYAYQVAPAGCSNTSIKCQHYTLTATLSTGKTLVKQSLN